MLLKRTFDPSNVDTDGIAANLVVTGSDTDGIANDLPVGTEWETGVDAEWVETEVDGGRARNIRVTTAADEPAGNAPTLTLIGTDADGEAITEDVVLPDTTFVDTVQRFLTVTSATASAATSGTMDIGWVIRDWNSDDDAEWLLTAVPDGLAHQLGVTTAADETTLSNTMTITGTDADDNVITDTVTLPSSSVVETTKYFKTVTSATTSSIGAGVFDIGWVDEFVSESIPLDWRRDVPSQWAANQTGTMNWSIDTAIESPQLAGDQSAMIWYAPNSSLSGETADTTAFQEILPGYTAARLRIASYTDTAEITLYGVQPEVA